MRITKQTESNSIIIFIIHLGGETNEKNRSRFTCMHHGT